MSQVTIRRSCAAEFEQEPNLPALFEEYAQESACPEMGAISVNLDAYKAVEAAGCLKVLTAHQNGQMVGFLVMLVNKALHFSAPAATFESFFVARAARQSGAGMALLWEAEAWARELDAKCLFVSAPAGGVLERVLAGKGWRHANTVFAKGLA